MDRLALVPLKLEIIAVNDGSKDDTGAHLDRLHKAGRSTRSSTIPRTGEGRCHPDRHRGRHR